MIHGILNVYKEKGFTSHDVVAKLRGIVGQKKIGHTGTLDPDATGVLPVCLGRATKVVSLLTDEDKVYETILQLGVETDTQDSSGKIIKEASTKDITEEAIRNCIHSFIGVSKQLPPMYSAIKIDGKKLYELAREGKEVERKERTISIYNINIISIQSPFVKMEITCSKGTYIRTICHDIGQELGCGGCMKELVRKRVGSYSIENAYTLTQIEEIRDQQVLSSIIIPIDSIFSVYPQRVVNGDDLKAVINGNPIVIDKIECKKIIEKTENLPQTLVRIYSQNGAFLALYVYNEQKERFQVEKMFVDQNTV